MSARTLTGPNRIDPARPGTKRHLIVDRQGTPLIYLLAQASCRGRMVRDAMCHVADLGIKRTTKQTLAKMNGVGSYVFSCCGGAGQWSESLPGEIETDS